MIYLIKDSSGCKTRQPDFFVSADLIFVKLHKYIYIYIDNDYRILTKNVLKLNYT